MNKYSICSIAILLAITCSCKGSGSSDADNSNSDSLQLYQTREELQATLAVQDSLFTLINEIGADMAQIRQIEALAAAPNNVNGESISKRNQMKNDIVVISQALQERRQRLAKLEKKLREANNQNANMLSTIETLKAQIAEQEVEINNLKEQLSIANTQISNLNSAVDSLNVSVANERTSKEMAIEKANTLNNELNAGFFAVGSKKELQAHNIIKSGFLRKTKIMQGDYELSYFTKVDKRNFSSLPLHSKKAKVLTNQPTDSYEIRSDASDQKTLVITNPTRFWNASNFIVIQID